MSSSNPRRARGDEDTEQLARELREQVRTLNYATAGPPGLTLPGTAYTILGCLQEAEYGLGQALQQLDQFLAHELAAGRLGHDSGQPADEAIDEARHALAKASGLAEGLSRALGTAQTAIAFIHAHTTDLAYTDNPSSTIVRTAATDFPQPLTTALDAPKGDPPPHRPRPDPPSGPHRAA